MRTIISTLILFLSLGLQAQNVNIPDANFKAELIHDGVDTNGDGEIQVSEAEAITILEIDEGFIADLTGIESFVNLLELNCEGNDLTSINLSALTQLYFLDCSSNQLTSIDVTALPLLSELDCQSNPISTLNLSQNPDLLILSCSSTQLSTIDVSNNLNLQELKCGGSSLTNIDISGNVNLTKFDCSYTSISNFDVSHNTALKTLYLDNNSLASIDISHNTNLTRLHLNNNNLTSLDVNANTKLSTLNFEDNNISQINLSNNPSLINLYVNDNSLTNLNLHNQSRLWFLECDHNQITSLDLSNSTHLLRVYCNDNQLEYLNVKNGYNSHMSAYSFKAQNNPALSCIEVDDASYSTSNWTNVDSGVTFSEDCHPGETHVPDDNFEQALIDLGYDTAPLDNFVTTANINTLTTLDVSNKNISDLTGIEDFTALQTLLIQDNSIAQLYIDQNTALKVLIATNNQITNLDVTQNTQLEVLRVATNQISELDLSQNTGLRILGVSGNQLSQLYLDENASLEQVLAAGNQLEEMHIKNGNNPAITQFVTVNNPDLSCINVDDIAYAISNWTNIDSTTSFGTYCHYTYVPDNNFEQALIDEGYDDSLDDYVRTSVINQLTSLSLSNKNISDLTGIEDFTSLNSLYIDENLLTGTLDLSMLQIGNLEANDNNLTSIILPTSIVEADLYNNQILSIDLSSLTELEDIDLSNNSLTSITLPSTQNVLEYLNLNDNQLTTIDLSALTNLSGFGCSNNQLTTLDLRTNMDLFRLYASNNQLTNIEINTLNRLSTCEIDHNNLSDFDTRILSNLFTFVCNNNQFTDLDLENNPNLHKLICNDNQLEHLWVKNGGNINIVDADFNATNNPNLTCIDVDDPSLSTSTWHNIDATASFNNSCQLNLDITTVGGGNVLASTSMSGTYNYNEIVELTATPDAGWQFTGWSGDLSGNTTPVNITMDSDKTITATFTQIQHTLSTTVVGNGSIALSPTGGTYNEGDTVQLTATPDAGWQFTGWSGDLSGSTNPVNIIMDSDKTITATFTQIQHTLSTTVVGNGSIALSPTGGTYNEGDSVQLTATPDAGWQFTGWSGDLTGTTNPATITMNSDKTITANFTLAARTYVPDNNFEQALIDLGYDDVLDDYVLTSNINNISSLNLRNKNITELTGIADFIALNNLVVSNNDLNTINISANNNLTELRCSNNNLNVIDVSNNVSLILLEINSNNITSINLANNNALLTLFCNNTPIANLDLSNNTLLHTLDITGTAITSLDLSNNTALEQLYIRNTNISFIDLSHNLSLEWLRCNNTQLTAIDVSFLPNLEKLNCSNNNLTSLNVQNGNNGNFTEFIANNNPNLTCIFVDNASYSTTNWTSIDATTHFVETQAECDALSIDEVLNNEITIYPNPTNNLVNIEVQNDVQIKQISILNMEGKVLWQQENTENISLQNFERGMYLIKINTPKGTLIKRIIKE